MDLLRTAVVDITKLVATCHALKSSPGEGDLAVQRKRRGRLRREIKRGTVAYIACPRVGDQCLANAAPKTRSQGLRSRERSRRGSCWCRRAKRRWRRSESAVLPRLNGFRVSSLAATRPIPSFGWA